MRNISEGYAIIGLNKGFIFDRPKTTVSSLIGPHEYYSFNHFSVTVIWVPRPEKTSQVNVIVLYSSNFCLESSCQLYGCQIRWETHFPVCLIPWNPMIR